MPTEGGMTYEKPSKYWAVKHWGRHEIIGIFQLDRSSNTVGHETIKAITEQIEDQDRPVLVWYPNSITEAEYGTYKAFGFPNFKTQSSRV